MSATASPTSSTPATAGRLAIPLIGVFFAVQAADPVVAMNALVKASRALEMTAGTMTLAASISTLMLAATVVSTGMLADRLGRRRALIAALVISIAGDAIAALAPSSAVFLLGRALAGVGLGAVFCAAFAYVSVVCKPAEIAKGIGRAYGVAGVTMIALNMLGGQLATANWRLAFLLIPAASLICLLFVPKVLPKVDPIPARGNDVVGQLLLAIGVILFLFGASHAAKGLTKPETLIGVFGGIVALGLFAALESRRGERAFFPIAIFRSPLFLASVAAGFVYNFGMSATLLQLADLWQYVTKFSASMVSLGQMPFFVTSIVASVLVGRMISAGVKPRLVILAGGIAAGAGLLSLLAIGPKSGYVAFLPALILTAAGCAAACIPYGSLVLEAIGDRFKPWFGPVTSSRATVGQFAYALGMSFSMVMVDRLTDGGVVSRLEQAGVSPSLTGQGLDQVAAYVHTGSDPSTELGRQALSAAVPSYTDAFTTTMGVSAVLVIAAGVVGWWLLGRRPAGSTA